MQKKLKTFKVKLYSSNKRVFTKKKKIHASH
jgi:hypothetical protein